MLCKLRVRSDARLEAEFASTDRTLSSPCSLRVNSSARRSMFTPLFSPGRHCKPCRWFRSILIPLPAGSLGAFCPRAPPIYPVSPSTTSCPVPKPPDGPTPFKHVLEKLVHLLALGRLGLGLLTESNLLRSACLARIASVVLATTPSTSTNETAAAATKASWFL